MYNEDNFFKGTAASFSSCEMPAYAPDHISESGSKYWYFPEGVIRASDHWGTVATCYWALDHSEKRYYLSEIEVSTPDGPVLHSFTVIKAGFCPWNLFRANAAEAYREVEFREDIDPRKEAERLPSGKYLFERQTKDSPDEFPTREVYMSRKYPSPVIDAVDLPVLEAELDSLLEEYDVKLIERVSTTEKPAKIMFIGRKPGDKKRYYTARHARHFTPGHVVPTILPVLDRGQIVK